MKYVPHNLPSWQHFTNSLFVEREASCWQDRSFSFLFVSFVELLQRSLLCFNYLSATFDGGIFRLYPRCLKYLQKASGYMCLFNLSAQIKLLLHLHVKAFSHPSQGKSLCKASVLPHPNTTVLLQVKCPHQGMLCHLNVLPGPFTASPWPAKHHLGNPRGCTRRRNKQQYQGWLPK